MSTIPSVAVRRWIKWADSSPSEPTSTLVLTSSRSFFVDVRVVLEGHDKDDEVAAPPSSTSDAIKNCNTQVVSSHFSQLDWAFAGTCSRTAETFNTAARGEWRHCVDSRHLNAELVKDQGEIFIFREGDEELELEKGIMPHPATGQLTAYEEVWASNADLCIDGSRTIERGCVVLSVSDEDKYSETSEVSGVVIRLGKWIQGIIRKQKQVLVERWAWNDGDMPDNNSLSREEYILQPNGFWRRLVQIKTGPPTDEDLELPCKTVAELEDSIIEGIEVESPGVSWKVLEITRW